MRTIVAKFELPTLSVDLSLRAKIAKDDLGLLLYITSLTIMLTHFPTGDEKAIDEKAELEMQTVIELISKVRNIRAEMQIKPSDRIAIHVAGDENFRHIFSENEAQILKLARADKLNLSNSLDVPKSSAKAVITGGAEIAIPARRSD
ncbi:MAG: hypothetical protein HC770_02095 [Pseudanabaena sp. CRU_2_10]|nr:hypothetical protein [Pseudanabaena sp. CRU_2_10]